ncbi:hypothetical protein OKT77_01665 [Bacillus anthracis]|uniref:hypothetical protein n=1 Tax=Bacillus anthracis TaxID=1392 RepID=UPI0022714373|nr:hypothetical protein [Bacillus anthracis]MCX9098301.1 hypothetical protein [Bacillus anthracis]
MKNRRNFYLLIIVTFVIMTAAKVFGNLYVAAIGVAFGLSVGLACLTDIYLKARNKNNRE